MAARPPSSSARYLAPIGLVLVTIAFFAVVLSSGTDDGSSGSSEPAAQRTTTARSKSGQGARSKSTYTVKTGDTLGEIAQKTGVSVQRLLELNPELDPQALVSGQKIKLRE